MNANLRDFLMENGRYQILVGDALERLRELPSESVHCVVTSPPYYGLRDYGVEGQIGLEASLGEFLERLVAVFREVRRVLRKDGTCWVNMGDAYVGNPGGGQGAGGQMVSRTIAKVRDEASKVFDRSERKRARETGAAGARLKPKDLMGQPWRLAFALQDDGWWLRQEIIWNKPNPMPESTKDRCTKSHEHLFLLTKSARYFWDAEAIAEPASAAMMQQVAQGYEGESTKLFEVAGAQDASGTKKRIIEGARKRFPSGWDGSDSGHKGLQGRYPKWAEGEEGGNGRSLLENLKAARDKSGNHDAPFGLTVNKRSVWTIPTHACKEAHFATYPPALVKPCVLAGCPKDGVVLDPFLGSGTTAMVALELGRRAIGIELNPEYAAMAERRISQVTPGLGI